MQKIQTFFLILFLTLFTASCSKTDSGKAATPGQAPVQVADAIFKTPDEAITSYLEGVGQNDIRKILQSCAINEIGKNFKFAAYAERLGVMNLQYLSPTDYQFYSELNKMQLSSQILGQVKNLSYSLLSSEKVDGSPIVQADAERVNKFIKDVDPQRLAKIELKKISLPNKTVMSDSKYLENAGKVAKTFGADESTERVALFSLDQNYYYLGFTLLRFGNNWKIISQSSPLASSDALGTAKKTTAEEFESMINGH